LANENTDCTGEWSYPPFHVENNVKHGRTIVSIVPVTRRRRDGGVPYPPGVRFVRLFKCLRSRHFFTPPSAAGEGRHASVQREFRGGPSGHASTVEKIASGPPGGLGPTDLPSSPGGGVVITCQGIQSLKNRTISIAGGAVASPFSLMAAWGQAKL